MAISFAVSEQEHGLIMRIVSRMGKYAAKHDTQFDRISCEMDITACHANGCRLRLRDLLKADDFNFTHDVLGIARHIDRETGELRDLFLPRFAEQPETLQ